MALRLLFATKAPPPGWVDTIYRVITAHRMIGLRGVESCKSFISLVEDMGKVLGGFRTPRMFVSRELPEAGHGYD